MSVVNGIITAPISVKDVYDCLGVAKTANGYDLGYICSNRHGKINKWSRAKPYRKNSLASVSISTDPTRMDGSVWGMSTPTMGIKEIYFNRIAANIIMHQSNSPNWEFQAPRGDAFNEPFRLTDFEGYNHNAKPVFTTGISNFKNKINLFDEEEITFFFMLMQGSDFSMKDFIGAFDGYKFVVEIYNDSPSTPWYKMTSPTHRYVSTNTIKNMQGWAEYITVSTTSLGETALVDKSIHICMGIQNFQGENPEGGTGIVAPWSESESDYPFYKQVSFENYFNREWKNVQYAFTFYNPTWYDFGSYKPLSFSGATIFVMKCQINRTGRRMYIVPQHPTNVPPGAYYIKVKATIYGTYNSSQYATILNSNLKEVSYTLVEETNQEGLYQDVYLSFNSLLKVGQANDVSLEATSDEGQNWVQMNASSINVTITN